MPKMNHERLAISEFQLWKDTVFGELMGAMANGFVQLTKGKLDIKKPTCTNVLMLGNPPHHYEDGQSKKEMMEAFGRYTPQIVSRLTLIFTQLKLNPEDKSSQVDRQRSMGFNPWNCFGIGSTGTPMNHDKLII